MLAMLVSWLHLPAFWAMIFVVFLWVITIVNPHPSKIFTDHVHYIHATLGKGKTALAAHYAAELQRESRLDKWLRKLLKKPPKKLRSIYSTFVLDGTQPLNLKEARWPDEAGALIIIDEILLLESNDLLPAQWFSRGCTLARQLQQQVILISQASRLPRKLDKYKGTIGLWMIVDGISFPSGRLVFVTRSGEPFVRRARGHKSHGSQRFIMWIPSSVFGSYNSRRIYGYTCDNDGDWIDPDMSINDAQRTVQAVRSGAGVVGASARSAAGVPAGTPDAPRRSSDMRPAAHSPAWHRRGGGRSKV